MLELSSGLIQNNETTQFPPFYSLNITQKAKVAKRKRIPAVQKKYKRVKAYCLLSTLLHKQKVKYINDTTCTSLKLEFQISPAKNIKGNVKLICSLTHKHDSCKPKNKV